jgi:hypothetical protein
MDYRPTCYDTDFVTTAPKTGSIATHLAHTPDHHPARVVSMALVLDLTSREEMSVPRSDAAHVTWFRAIELRAAAATLDAADAANLRKAITAHRSHFAH